MPNLRDQPVQGGPTQPVYVMNGLSGDPTGSSDTSVAGVDISTAGANTIIAAPAAGYRIVVYSFLIQNWSATASSAILMDLVERWPILGQNQGDGAAMVFEKETPWKLNAATALKIKLSAAVQWRGGIQYAIEPCNNG